MSLKKFHCSYRRVTGGEAALLLRLDHRRNHDGVGHLGCAGVSNITMAVVLKPISNDLGWSRSLTAAAITMGALVGGILSPLFGPLADRLGPRFLLPLGGALVRLLAFGVSRSTEPWQFYATFVPARANGISSVRHGIFHRYFGRRSFGAISSVLDPFHKGGLGLGALIAGIAFDYTGNYQVIFMLFFVCYFVSALSIILLRPPERTAQ